MKLHFNSSLFREIILTTSSYLGIRDLFIEKDYWSTYLIYNLAKSDYSDMCVFKGGTSLSKVYKLINRFSEDVDLAVLTDSSLSQSQVKNLIRKTEKSVCGILKEIQQEDSSKGSKHRKSYLRYDSILKNEEYGKIVLEISAFSNPYLFEKMKVESMIGEYLKSKNMEEYLYDYELQNFYANVLSKEQTMNEKIVSLLRASLANDGYISLASKIRHFYDLYFLTLDKECKKQIEHYNFKNQISVLFESDKRVFSMPEGWINKSISDSILITDFENIWEKLSNRYSSELSILSYKNIPSPNDVKTEVIKIFKKLA